MDLTKIVSISGKSGLFKVVSQGKNLVIVESLADQKRFPAFGHEKMSSLEEISVFTTGEDRPLKDVFRSFHEKLEGKAEVDSKSENSVLLKFFEEMVPDFDHERVYISDIRKMISWYNLLAGNNMLDFTEAEENKPADQAEQEGSESSTPEVIEADTNETETTHETEGTPGEPGKTGEVPAVPTTELPEKTRTEAKPAKKTPKVQKQE